MQAYKQIQLLAFFLAANPLSSQQQPPRSDTHTHTHSIACLLCLCVCVCTVRCWGSCCELSMLPLQSVSVRLFENRLTEGPWNRVHTRWVERIARWLNRTTSLTLLLGLCYATICASLGPGLARAMPPPHLPCPLPYQHLCPSAPFTGIAIFSKLIKCCF